MAHGVTCPDGLFPFLSLLLFHSVFSGAVLIQPFVIIFLSYPHFAMCNHLTLPLYNQTKPDVMILDIMMPGKNGLDAVSEIRLFDPQANIIVESARDDEALKLRAKILGVSAYLVKPFGLAELTEALKPFSSLERTKELMR